MRRSGPSSSLPSIRSTSSIVQSTIPNGAASSQTSFLGLIPCWTKKSSGQAIPGSSFHLPCGAACRTRRHVDAIQEARQNGRLDLRAGDDEDFLPRLLTGDNHSARQKTLPELYADRKANSPHDAWMVEAGRALSTLTTTSPTGLVKLSYEALQGYRARLMKEVDKVLKTQDIPGPRQLGAKLKQLRVLPSENEAASDQVLAEFMRSVLLSGNGTLLINNTSSNGERFRLCAAPNLRSRWFPLGCATRSSRSAVF